MNINIILRHEIFKETGNWYSDISSPFHVLGKDGIQIMDEWSVPGWPESIIQAEQSHVEPAVTHVDPDTGETIIDVPEHVVIDVPEIKGQVPPDISTFTEADSVSAESAWNEHVQASKSLARRTAENTLIKFCDTINGGTAHTALSPTAAYSKYKAAVDAGQATAANAKIIPYILACINIIAADMDVQWHPEIES